MDAAKVYGIANNKTVSTGYTHAQEKGFIDWAQGMIRKGYGPIDVVVVIGRFENRTPPIDYIAYTDDGKIAGALEIQGMPQKPTAPIYNGPQREEQQQY